MNEFELVEAWYLVQENLQSNFVTVSTAIFAYVVAAHFVGKILGRGTAMSLSTIYSLVVLPPILMRMPEFSRWHRIHVEYIARFPDGVVFQGEGAPLIMMNLTGVGPFIVAWVMSLIYMHAIMRRKSPGPR